MKALLIVRWPVGGIRTFLNYIYSEWPDENLKLHILTPNLKEVDTLKNNLSKKVVTWHSTNNESPTLFEFCKKANSIQSEYEFDIIHAHGFTSGISIGWKLPFIRTKSVITSHDVINHNQFLGLKGTFKKCIISLILNQFSVIQSVSNDAQSNLKDSLPFISKSKLTVILNGINTEHFFKSSSTKLKQQLQLRDETYLIGFFGRFMSQKGFRYLVDSLELLNQMNPGRYHVVCFGSGAFIREEKLNIHSKGLSDIFHFHDPVPDTAPYYKGCDMVAMPSLWEACGLVAMEVLTSGIPLVASDCSGLREVCRGTPAIFCKARDSRSLMNAIIECQKTPKLVFEEYAQYAKIRFDVTSTRNEYLKLYQDLLE